MSEGKRKGRREGAGRVAGMVALPSPHSCSVLDRDAFSQKIPELPLLQNDTWMSHDGAMMSHATHLAPVVAHW